MDLRFKVPFICPDDIAPHLESVFLGEYDVPFYPRNPPRIIDLGANCGAFSVWASHRWPGALIDSYEPHPENFKYLVENTKRYPNIEVHNYAIGTPGLRILSNGKFNGGEASLIPITNNPYPTGQHVEVRSPLFLTRADILKLDVEGSEIEVLRPLIEEGRSFSAILLEFHSDELRREVDSLLSDYRLVAGFVANSIGRGTFCYLHNGVSI